jgi:hypothetical protein
MNLLEIRAKARRLKQRHDLKLIVVDYLQLMTPPKWTASRQQEVAGLSRGLKLLAKEIECPVIAVSQLNRGPEQCTDKRPRLSDCVRPAQSRSRGSTLRSRGFVGEMRKMKSMSQHVEAAVVAATGTGLAAMLLAVGQADIAQPVAVLGFAVSSSSGWCAFSRPFSLRDLLRVSPASKGRVDGVMHLNARAYRSGSAGPGVRPRSA